MIMLSVKQFPCNWLDRKRKYVLQICTTKCILTTGYKLLLKIDLSFLFEGTNAQTNGHAGVGEMGHVKDAY